MSEDRKSARLPSLQRAIRERELWYDSGRVMQSYGYAIDGEDLPAVRMIRALGLLDRIHCSELALYRFNAVKRQDIIIVRTVYSPDYV